MKFMTCALVLGGRCSRPACGRRRPRRACSTARRRRPRPRRATPPTRQPRSSRRRPVCTSRSRRASRPRSPRSRGARLEAGRIRRRLNDLPAAETALKEAAAATDEPRIATEALHDLASVYRKTQAAARGAAGARAHRGRVPERAATARRGAEPPREPAPHRQADRRRRGRAAPDPGRARRPVLGTRAMRSTTSSRSRSRRAAKPTRAPCSRATARR